VSRVSRGSTKPPKATSKRGTSKHPKATKSTATNSTSRGRSSDVTKTTTTTTTTTTTKGEAGLTTSKTTLSTACLDDQDDDVEFFSCLEQYYTRVAPIFGVEGNDFAKSTITDIDYDFDAQMFTFYYKTR
jgi:hypothetical protein